MAANLAKVLAGEAASAAALQLWSAGVHEERGLKEFPEDRAPKEPLDAPTALDIARMMQDNHERTTVDELARLRRPAPTHPGYTARSDLATEMRRLVAEVGALAEWFAAGTTRDNLADWMCGRTIPSLHHVMNFAYELRLENEGWVHLLRLHAAAEAEARSEMVRYMTNHA
ncbi:hypothetical protein AB0I30_10155 [Nocardia tengchongensis]|uniref:hypothetical protein n=1 Tax=Nocardia tengchongensis TaxID=2055889 RepID=UPI0033F59ADD